MRVDVVTIFPRMFPGPLGDGIMGRAISRGLVELVAHDLRDYAPQPHRQVDDEPFGGGARLSIPPQLGMWGGEPTPRKLREASIMIAVPK